MPNRSNFSKISIFDVHWMKIIMYFLLYVIRKLQKFTFSLRKSRKFTLHSVRVVISDIFPHRAPRTTAIFFRQIDSQYNSLVKKLIWRNFCKKSWGKSLQISTLWHPVPNLSTFLRKILHCQFSNKLSMAGRMHGIQNSVLAAVFFTRWLLFFLQR